MMPVEPMVEQVPTQEERPVTRADCAKVSRPCRWRDCRFHMGDDSPVASCVLDLADRGGMTLEECGEVFGLTRERIRQIETVALRKLKNRGVTLKMFLQD